MFLECKVKLDKDGGVTISQSVASEPSSPKIKSDAPVETKQLEEVDPGTGPFGDDSDAGGPFGEESRAGAGPFGLDDVKSKKSGDGPFGTEERLALTNTPPVTLIGPFIFLCSCCGKEKTDAAASSQTAG